MAAAFAVACIDDIAPSRWRNGGGWTRELCAWPAPDNWVVRVSVADVEADGPFSAFSGVDRWFAVLDGDGVELVHDGGPAMQLTRDGPIHRFRGESATACRLLGGPTRDFNLMVRRDLATAHVVPLDAAPAEPGEWTACFANAPVRVRTDSAGAWHALAPRTLAWTTAPTRLAVDAATGIRGWRIDVRAARRR